MFSDDTGLKGPTYQSLANTEGRDPSFGHSHIPFQQDLSLYSEPEDKIKAEK